MRHRSLEWPIDSDAWHYVVRRWRFEKHKLALPAPWMANDKGG
jgi:hypothetical protein